MDELNWEEVVAVQGPSKKFAFVNVSCKYFEKTKSSRINISLTSEIVKALGWDPKNTKFIQCMTAIDFKTNKRLLQFIRKSSKKEGPFELVNKLKDSGMITLYDLPWMPKQSVAKQNVFHQEEPLKDGILRIELPNTYTDEDVLVPLKKVPSLKTETPPDAPSKPASTPVSQNTPVKQHTAIDEVVPSNDMRAVLGKARMHACSPELNNDNALETFYNNEKKRVKLQASWALVLRFLMDEQERGRLQTSDGFFNLLTKNGVKFKQDDTMKQWVHKINAAYLEQTHLRAMVSNFYVYLTTAAD